MDKNVLAALGLSLFAGLSTSIGGLIVLTIKKVNVKYCLLLGFQQSRFMSPL